MEKLTLQYITREPNTISDKTSLLILLHGYGSNEEDLFSFATELPEDLIIISARAPQNLGFGSYSWYTINFTADTGKFSDIPEAIEARELIAKFIGEIQEKYKISPEKTFLLGFSQGTILSYAVALNYPEKVQKVIALSGYINPELLPTNLETKDYSKLDFFISHGSVDQVIPVEWANKAPQFLNSLKVKNCYQEYPVGHGVAPKNFFDFKQWIEVRF
ncbi:MULTISPECIES: alpha/beta hydrolase [Flavobacteriaceae]|uniref:Alpha/beta fold hydrolase n=2 Tax=Flavobacteriaceae TaxID=49546 RepID=A0A4Y8AYI9_9FLAO|nr:MULTISPECIES: alpha/beta fold hydrolase [Flavobacteriaceae]TEW76952.1 alpha/beta fold hydrolase [Gramella jeungdoensis]GGK59078.1 phospholipase [Lutibacter litoralis]